MKDCVNQEAQSCLKKISPQDEKKRLFVFGGILAAISAFIFAKTNRKFNPDQTSATDLLMLGQTRLDFLKETREIKNYLIQINQLKTDLFKSAEHKHPELAPQLIEKLNEDFWTKHQERLVQAFYQDIVRSLSEEDAHEALKFFKTKAGQNYLIWKDLIQGRNSNLFAAFQKMNDEIGFHYKSVISSSDKKTDTMTNADITEKYS